MKVVQGGDVTHSLTVGKQQLEVPHSLHGGVLETLCAPHGRAAHTQSPTFSVAAIDLFADAVKREESNPPNSVLLKRIQLPTDSNISNLGFSAVKTPDRV